MAYSIHISHQALGEIDEALKWYAERSVAVAIRWHTKLTEAIRALEDNPERYELAPESEWYPELRQMLYGKKRGTYRILFKIRDDAVYIFRVRHSAQAWLEPDDL